MFNSVNFFIVQGMVLGVTMEKERALYRVATSLWGSTRMEAQRAFPLISFHPLPDEIIKAGECVSIQGYASNRVTMEDGKPQFHTELEGVILTHAQRMLAAYIPGLSDTAGGMPDDKNFVVAAGLVHHLYYSRDGIAVTIETNYNGRHAYVEFLCQKRQAMMAGTLHKGDSVAMAGYIMTEPEGNSQNAIRLLCRDMAIERAPGQAGASGAERKTSDTRPGNRMRERSMPTLDAVREAEKSIRRVVRSGEICSVPQAEEAGPEAEPEQPDSAESQEDPKAAEREGRPSEADSGRYAL